MTRRVCRVFGILMFVLAALAIGYSTVLHRQYSNLLEDDMVRMTNQQAEQDETLERQRQVVELISVIECRRHAVDANCMLGKRGAGQECVRRVMVDGVPRTRNCAR